MTTRLTGRITIDPPMRWSACRNFKESELDRPIAVEVDSQFSFTDDGEETIRRGVAIIPLLEWPGSVKPVEITAHIREIVDAAIAYNPSTEFSGEIILHDEQGEMRHFVDSDTGFIVAESTQETIPPVLPCSTSPSIPDLPSILVEAITKPGGGYSLSTESYRRLWFTRAEIDPSSDQWILLHGVNDQYESSPIAVRVSSITRVSRVKGEEEE